ncbi:cystathionine beta-lyase [Xylogone sp. PMI_703]|nr:cystathionine beta-lyase [Xylogone sp. PMI_703]
MEPISLIPKSFPLGESLPPDNLHAVSVSCPTWESVTAWAKREQWIMRKMTTGYPRFFINATVRRLNDAVLWRLKAPSPDMIGSMIFVSPESAARCVESLSSKATNGPDIEVVRFFLPNNSEISLKDAFWASFSIVLYPAALSKEANAYWRDTGDGISTRHAEFCLEVLDYLQSEIIQSLPSGVAERHALQESIACLVTSEQPGQKKVNPEDVFIYPRGMSAIYATARALSIIKSPYGGMKEELDELEAEFVAGKRIQALFCELPGNPQLATPDLHHVLPYVDIVMSSLTKMFSGYSDVMGGSVVINPESPYYDLIHHKLTAVYEDTCFPPDLVVLRQNSADFMERVQRSNRSGKLVVELLAAHPSVMKLNYPSTGATAQLYEKYRRRNGGYGHLMSIIFHDENSAKAFYDGLDTCKGTSFGANFTLAVPYAQLAHYHELDWVEIYGVPRHLVRLSVGLEDADEILKAVTRALVRVEGLEQSAIDIVNIKPVAIAA